MHVISPTSRPDPNKTEREKKFTKLFQPNTGNQRLASALLALFGIPLGSKLTIGARVIIALSSMRTVGCPRMQRQLGMVVGAGIRLGSPLPTCGGGCEPPQDAVVPDRRRGGLLRRERHGHLPALAPSAERAPSILELKGADLRREPIEVRKATLASILGNSRSGVRLNEHLEHECGLTVFQLVCKMAVEGIVSKRLGSRYRSGRSPDWLKFKNPDAPAVR
jgi:hypothetical protein